MSWNERCLRAIRLEKTMGSQRYAEEIRGYVSGGNASWILNRTDQGKKKASCSVCKRPVYDNVDPEKIITCAHCVQGLLLMSVPEKLRLRDGLIDKGDLEAGRSVEFFIPDDESEEVILNGRKTQKLRPSMDGKGPLPKVRPQGRQGSFFDAGSLDHSRAEMH